VFGAIGGAISDVVHAVGDAIAGSGDKGSSQDTAHETTGGNDSSGQGTEETTPTNGGTEETNNTGPSNDDSMPNPDDPDSPQGPNADKGMPNPEDSGSPHGPNALPAYDGESGHPSPATTFDLGSLTNVAHHGSEAGIIVVGGHDADGGGFWDQAAQASSSGFDLSSSVSSHVGLEALHDDVASVSHDSFDMGSHMAESFADLGAHADSLAHVDNAAMPAASHADLGAAPAHFEVAALHGDFALQMHI
jgi:hypothetical protein